MSSTKTRSLRIYVHAYWQQNLGDDLFVKVLCERYPEVLFYGACSRRKSRAFEALDNFRRVPRLARVDRILSRLSLGPLLGPALERLYKARSDAVVNIGGSIFIEREGWRQRMPAMRARFGSGKQTYVVGSNFGPYEDPHFLDEYKALLRGGADVCFRDKVSAELFEELPNCRYAPDVILSMDPGETADHGTAVISVIDLETRPSLREHSNAYTTKLSEVALACIAAGLDVVLMSFCRSEQDVAAAKRLSQELDKAGASVRSYTYDGDLLAALTLLSTASVIIGTRFHAVILAWVFGKRVLPISYSPKTEHVLRDLAFPGEWINLEEIAELDVANSVSELLRSAPFAVGELRAMAEQQFAGLDAFVAQPLGSRSGG
ncbi:polysaccharide pyruvyl transferase family protein [Tessaracoccus flavus]|uniref:Uncharacterized protein n=1 Tax=Tessaracoccus flavus TaxID=1610493 RepID=A0A1Q2CI26_9ACTN|nr:polysaccharide pyruvyl transferase family protein [Tessaracoccus flavus]AQP45778.1 hypothetical protein RPIT_14015 [Tessaracoccus flavus]SDZ20969.1 colanic acid/amylovoran biosynthesis protein [Tessaracoccus flavus]